jgi:hypothetical protein
MWIEYYSSYFFILLTKTLEDLIKYHNDINKMKKE